MSEVSRAQYYEEIRAIADNMAAEALADNDWNRSKAEEDINDSRLHETIDGHEWVIYTAYNLDIIRHSGSAYACVDNFGGDHAAAVLKDRGIDALHALIAYCAMEQDVQNILSDSLDDALEAHEQAA